MTADERPEVSFADVAAEDAAESVAPGPATEVAPATAAPDDAAVPDDEEADGPERPDDPLEPGLESENDTPPEQPTISSVLAPGPVSPGDDITP